MFDDFLKFLRGLGKKTGIVNTSQAEKKLQEAADQFTKKTDLGEVTGKFDETTKPGEFKKSKEKIIDQEGNVEAEVFSYRPESFTDMQRRERIGEFSDESLREQFFDYGLDDTMSFSEFEDLRLAQGKNLDEVLERQRILERIATDDPVLDDLLRQERELIEQSSKQTEELKTIRARTDEVKEQLEAMGLDTSGVDFDIIKNSDDVNAVRAEADKLRELMGGLMGGMEDLAKTGNLEKAMLSINDEVAADIARGKAALDNVTTPAEGEEIISKLQKIQSAYQEAIRTGVYKPLFPEGRTVNAKGGRIGFKEGSGGPKMTRRGFLGAMGAGLATLFMPRGAKEIAEVVAKGAVKTPLTAEGMPIWYPSLVNKIRKEGKLRKADFESVKSGEGMDMYTFTDPSLPNKQIFMEEDLQTGAITIYGRGDDMQVAELRFIPGEESIMVGEKSSKTTKNPNMFEAEEFMKGPGEGIGDYENFGGMDDLKFGVDSWANLVKAPEQKLDEAAQKFRETQTNPNPNVSGKNPKTGEEFAKGGRVGYNTGGGVQTLFRRKAS